MNQEVLLTKKQRKSEAKRQHWLKEKLFFVHCRIEDEKGRLIPMGGVTFCYKVLECDDESKQRIKFGMAICSLTEHFEKKEGRNRSSGRLKMKNPPILKFENGFETPSTGEVEFGKDISITDYLRAMGESLFNSVYLDKDDLEDEELDVEDDDEDEEEPESSLH